MLVYAILRIKPDTDIAAVKAHAKEEAKAVWQHVAADRFRRVSFGKDRPIAVIEVEAADVEAARASIATLPIVKAGHVDVELIPVGPYRQLEALFAA